MRAWLRDNWLHLMAGGMSAI